MSNGLTLARVPAVWHQVAVGVVILTSVTLNSHRIRWMPRRRPTR
jgi:predicted ABC-type sugar transport system permease subunit